MSTHNQKIHVGIIGGNFGSSVHLPAFTLDNRCKVLGISASTNEKSQQLSSKYNLPKSYFSWEEMLNDNEIDAISIAVPPSLQPGIAMAAIKKGKAVFAEKPLAAHLSQAEELQQVAFTSGLPNMINFHLSTLDSWISAKKILQEGGIGDLQNVSVNYSGPSPLHTNWKLIKGPGTGALFDFASHFFHALEWFAGPIAGLNTKLFSTMHNEPMRDTFDVLAISFLSGAAASIIVNRTSILDASYRIEFFGAEGTLMLENKSRDVHGFHLYHATRNNNKLELICGPCIIENKKYADGRIYTTSTLIRRFLDWFETGNKINPNFDEGLRVQHLLDAAFNSDKHSKWFNL